MLFQSAVNSIMNTHNKFIRMSKRLINRNGRKIQVVNTVNSGTGWNPDQSETKTYIKAAQVAFDKQDLPDDLVGKVDKVFLCQSGTVIDKSNKLNDAGELLSIHKIAEVKPGDLNVQYKVYCGA